MAAFDYIESDDLKTAFEQAKKFALPLHEPFSEWERIARNRPHPGIAKDLPKVTDGTLASIIQEKPKRIIQQIPTGVVETEDDDEWLELVASYILENVMLPNANEEGHLIQKCWAAVSKSMIYGSQPAFIKFLNRGDYFGTDFVLPYVKDVLLEPGKVSDKAANIMFLRTWLTKNQVKALLQRESKLKKNADSRGDNYESGWSVKLLQDLLDEGTEQKDVNAQSPYEKGKLTNTGFYEFVHVFQRGIESQFYTFTPRMADGENILRTKTNPDPRGEVPITFMYADQDFSNPLGRGALEMSGGMQNLLDSEVQMYQFNRALMLNPPLKKRGSFSKANVKMVPNHIIELGVDAYNDVEAMVVDNTALSNFPNNYGLMKSQILNLNQSGDTTSTGADVGNPGFSKTPQGIKTQDARLGISDNHMRKQFESWFGEVTETMLNLYFAERKGVQQVTVDDETAYKLNEIQPGAVNVQNQIRVDYDTETPKLKFTVDASSSDMKDNQSQVEAAQELLELVAQYPQLDSKQGGPIDVVELADRIVAASGIENPEKIVQKPKPGEAPAQQPQASITPEIVAQMIQQAFQMHDSQQPENHPVARVIAALNLKGTDLDPDTLRVLVSGMLQDLGIQAPPSNSPLPMEVDMASKMHDQQLKQASQDQQHQIEAANTALKAASLAHDQVKTAADTGIKLGQAAKQASQADNSHALQIAQAQQSAQQAQQSHDLQAQQTPQPQQQGAK